MPSRSGGGDILKIIRVFLASPGDLGEERRAARDAVKEINRTVARPAGFQVDLIGWEDTLSAAGRPQALINEDLKTCQMFIGMIWARWGTPTGAYSSGFEEEFELACSRHASQKEPHITMFFKEVDPSKLSDPGPELSKVIKFKKRAIQEKKIFFDTFEDPNEFASKVRLVVADFIHKLDLKSRLESVDTGSIVTASESGLSDEASEESSQEISENDVTESQFLNEIGTAIGRGHAERISRIDVARLRNLAAAHAFKSNDQVSIGAHDANIVYISRAELDLSAREKSSLGDAGLDAWNDENTPVWSWISDRLAVFPEWLIYSTWIGPDTRRAGAFKAMTLLKATVPSERFEERRIADRWFGDDVGAQVRNAALGYIGVVGSDMLVELAKSEFARNDYATRKTALDAVIAGLARDSARAAAAFALGASFEELSEEAFNEVSAGIDQLNDDELLKGLEHRSGYVRAKSLSLLSERRKLEESHIRRFFADDSIPVRRAALTALESLGHEVGE